MTDEVVRTARGPEQLQAALGAWLADRVPGGEVTAVEVPSSNGMSSETVLLDARWDHGGGSVERALVARIAPEASAVPVFPTYDLEKQARVMADARAAAPTVPVPEVGSLQNFQREAPIQLHTGGSQDRADGTSRPTLFANHLSEIAGGDS